MTALTPPHSKVAVNIADRLVDRYLAAGWTRVGAPETAEKPKKQVTKRKKKG